MLKARSRRLALAAAALSGVTAALLPVATARAQGAVADAGSRPVPARYAHQRLDWHACGEGSPLECAAMTVPRDWHHPGPGTATGTHTDISVEVSRHKATGPAKDRRGVLMTAAGGPGGSGLLRPAGLVSYAPKLAAAYDIVSFDQRGVGRSTRARCQSEAGARELFAGDFRDRSPNAVTGVLDRSRAMAESCRDNTGALLPYLTTDQTVRDMDLYRSLLGAGKVSYYGASYATTVGAYYATEFPRRVERVVLDSNIDFTSTMERWETGQPHSFQRRFDEDFLPWLAAHDATYHYGRTAAEAKATWERNRRALRDHPLTVVDPLDGTTEITLGANQFDVGTSNAIYRAAGFPGLARALDILNRWDSATPDERKLIPRSFGYQPAAFNAEFFSVTCNDTRWNRDIDHWVQRTADLAGKYPLVGARSLTYAATCAYWPDSRAPRITVTGEGLPPTLMLNSLHDPATYYEGAVAAHRNLRGSRLVTVEGGDHGQYQNHNACVDRIVDAYLLDDTLPAHDTTCAAPPLPSPASG